MFTTRDNRMVILLLKLVECVYVHSNAGVRNIHYVIVVLYLQLTKILVISTLHCNLIMLV